MQLRRSIARILIATVVLVVWGMVFWGVLYESVGVFRDGSVADMEAVSEALTKAGVPSGTYFFPWPRNTKEAAERWLEQHEKGPFFELNYSREGVNPQTPGKFARGILQYIVVSSMGFGLVALLGSSATYRRRFMVVALAGAMGTLFSQLSRPIWFHLPWHYSLAHALFEGVAWMLLAVTMAWPTRAR